MYLPPALPELTPNVAIVYTMPSSQDLTPALEHDEAGRTDENRTAFVELAAKMPSFERHCATTRSSRDTELGPRLSRGSAAPTLAAPDELDRAREERIALLARRHEGAGSIEDDARFQILTERLRRLAPRVTPRDFEPIEAALTAVESAASTLEALRAKFGVR
jgi:hypothetical protein